LNATFVAPYHQILLWESDFKLGSFLYDQLLVKRADDELSRGHDIYLF